MRKVLKNSLVASFLTVSVLGSALALAEGVVIVNPANSASLSASDISRIFLGKKKSFPDGGSAVPINLKDGDGVRSEFTTVVLKKNDQQLKSYWAQQLFTGKGTPPKEVDSSQAMKDLVSKNPSLIGYINAADADDSVKVVHSF